MADAAWVQEPLSREQKNDALRSLLQQRLGPEDAAVYELYLDSLVSAEITTAGILRRTSRQQLEKAFIPSGLIHDLAAPLTFAVSLQPRLVGCPASSDLNAASMLSADFEFPCQAPIL